MGLSINTNVAALNAYRNLGNTQNDLSKSLEDIRQCCEARGVAFAGDTIERNVTYEGILETAKAEGVDLIVMVRTDARVCKH